MKNGHRSAILLSGSYIRYYVLPENCINNQIQDATILAVFIIICKKGTHHIKPVLYTLQNRKTRQK